MNTVCYVCGTRATEITGVGVGKDCPRCGQFLAIGTASDVLRRLLSTGAIKGAILSHQLRMMFEAKQSPIQLVETDLHSYIGDSSLPAPREQADRLIRWMGDAQEHQDQWSVTRVERLAAIVGTPPGTGRNDEPELQWLIRELKNKGLFEIKSRSRGRDLKFRLLIEGWKQYQELRRGAADGHVAFIAMKFGDPEIDRVFADSFRPAVQRAGFTLQPLNEVLSAGPIDNQTRAAIRSARFVIADLTHDDHAANLEAGLAEGIGRPVIYTCESEKLHAKMARVGTNHVLTIPWDVAHLEDAGNRLTAAVRWILPGEAAPS
jgi:hypothetical protein